MCVLTFYYWVIELNVDQYIRGDDSSKIIFFIKSLRLNIMDFWC